MMEDAESRGLVRSLLRNLIILLIIFVICCALPYWWLGYYSAPKTIEHWMGVSFPQEATDVFAFVQIVPAQGMFAYAKFKLPQANVDGFLNSLCGADYEFGQQPNRKWEWSFWEYGIYVPFGWNPPTESATYEYVQCSPTQGSDSVGISIWMERTDDPTYTIWMELTYSQ